MNKAEQDLAMVERDGMKLGLVDKPQFEIMLAAVKQNGRALQFVEKQTDILRMAAVMQLVGLEYKYNPF